MAISLLVCRDGLRNLGGSIGDLMDRVPVGVDRERIDLLLDPASFEIAVSDSGCGIAPEILAVIFETFLVEGARPEIRERIIAEGTPDQILADEQVRDIYLGTQFRM